MKIRRDLLLLQQIITLQGIPGGGTKFGRLAGVLTTGGPFMFSGTDPQGNAIGFTRGMVIVNPSTEYTLLVKKRAGAGSYVSAATYFVQPGGVDYIAIPPLQDSRWLACTDPEAYYMLAVGGTIDPWFNGH